MIAYGGVTLSNVAPYAVDYAPVCRARQLLDGSISLQGSLVRRVAWDFECRTSDPAELASLAALAGQRLPLTIDGGEWSSVMLAYLERRAWGGNDIIYSASFVQDVGATFAGALPTYPPAGCGATVSTVSFDGWPLTSPAPYPADFGIVLRERPLVGGGVALQGAARTRNAWAFDCITPCAAELAALAARIGLRKTLTVDGVDYANCMIAPPFRERMNGADHVYTISFLQETYAQ